MAQLGTSSVIDIQRWAAVHDAYPLLNADESLKPHERVSFAFGKKPSDGIQKISWQQLEDFFRKHGLVFVYEDNEGGEERPQKQSRYYRIASDESIIEQAVETEQAEELYFNDYTPADDRYTNKETSADRD